MDLLFTDLRHPENVPFSDEISAHPQGLFSHLENGYKPTYLSISDKRMRK
jgi:hypothetical protein